MADDERRLKNMTKAQLKELASRAGVDLGGIRKKDDIIRALLDFNGDIFSFLEEEQKPSPPPEEIVETLDQVEEEITEIMADTEEAIAMTEKITLEDEDEINRAIEDARNKMVDFGTLEQYLNIVPKTFERREYALSLYQVVAAERISERVISEWNLWNLAWIISSAEQMILELESVGYAMDKERKLLRLAKRSFMDADLPAKRKTIRDLEEAVKKAFENRMSEIEQSIHRLESEMEKVKEIGGDVSDAMELIQGARNALLKYNHVGAEKRILEVESSIELARSTRIQEINDYFPRAEKVIEDGKLVGADMSEAEHLLNLARESYKRGDYLMTGELLGRAEEKALEGQEEQIKKALQLRRAQITKATEIINYGEPFIREAIAYGLAVGNAPQLISEVKAAITSDDYVEALRCANEVKSHLSTLKPEIMAVRERRGIHTPEKGICSRCGSDKLSFSDNGTGVCGNCNYTFMWLKFQPVGPGQAPPAQVSAAQTRAPVTPAAHQAPPTAEYTCPKCGIALQYHEGVGLVCPTCGHTRAVAKKEHKRKRGLLGR